METLALVSLLITAVLLLLGVEILVCLGGGAILMTLMTGAFPIENVGFTAFSSINIFPLLAMPLYILTGDLVSAGGISHMFVVLAKSLVGWVRGGLAVTTMVAAEGFAAISGSNSATVAAMGRIMVPELKEDGYPEDFAAGTIACCGTIGIITPPSIVFILYGVTAGTSIGDLFLGGVLPGLILVTAMSTAALTVCWRRGYGSTFPFDLGTALRAAWKAKLAFGAIAIILGGIYGGLFTPTEAAGISVSYCLLAGLFITREIKVKQLPAIMAQSSGVNGMIAPIIAMAMIFSELLAVTGLPQAGVSFLLGFSENPTAVMGLVLLILLIAGCVMEATPNILLLTPLLVPVANSLGYHPVHFGVIMVVTLAIGFVTPPLGLNLFVASSVTGVSFTRIAVRAIPYIIALVTGLLIIWQVPYLSLIFLEH
ncbi:MULTISPECIES: TRAP transporter large permease [Desulfosediminicola]|uniref:TRAP transporter large permease n=1 Tax=Desulfosediminicola TaxID=2886823 RepID=UPI0010ABDB3D|nr:TRAP transporter large permease [Desulfosediminicola ganghwensis]